MLTYVLVERGLREQPFIITASYIAQLLFALYVQRLALPVVREEALRSDGRAEQGCECPIS